MKTKTFTVFSLFAASALLLGACSTINSRINEKGSVYYSLDEPTRAKIAHGDVGLGFTSDMVYMALGQPDAKRTRTTGDGASEIWIYRPYYDHFDGGVSVGYRRWGGWGPGYYRMYWAPVTTRYTGDDIRVTFRDGKVVTIDQGRA